MKNCSTILDKVMVCAILDKVMVCTILDKVMVSIGAHDLVHNETAKIFLQLVDISCAHGRIKEK